MLRYIVEKIRHLRDMLIVVEQEPHNEIFYLLYYQGARDPYEIAKQCNYKVSFVKRYIRSLKRRGWIIEKGKQMEKLSKKSKRAN